MANPFQAIGSIPIMQTVTSLMQQQAQLRNQQILGDERQQLMQIRAQEMQERQATMRALQQDLQGGIQSQIDKSNIPSEDDTPIGLAQKNIRSLQQQFTNSNQTALRLAQTPGSSPEVAMQFRKEADAIQARLIQANRELRLEQRNQARMMGESAGAIVPDGSNFDQVMNDLRAQDPRIDRKYNWDRDVDGKPVYGDTSRRTLSTISQSSMTAKDQVEQRLKLDKAAQDAQDRELKRKKEEEEIKRIDSQTELNKARTAKVQAPKSEEDKPSKSADRLQAIADRVPTKDAVAGARSAIRGEFKGEFDDSIDTLAQSVAAKTNELRANAAKRGEELDMDDARSQAIDLIRPYVKSTEQGWTDPIFGYHFGSGTKLSFNRAATPLPKGEPPKAGSDADLLKRLNAVGLEIGITNGKVNGKGGPGNPVQLSKDSDRADVQYEALPSGTEFVGPDGQKRTKP